MPNPTSHKPKFRYLIALGLALLAATASQGRPRAEGGHTAGPHSAPQQPNAQHKGGAQGGAKPDLQKVETTLGTAQMQVTIPPVDIVVEGKPSDTNYTVLTIHASDSKLCLNDLKLSGGELVDKSSGYRLPSQSFMLQPMKAPVECNADAAKITQVRENVALNPGLKPGIYSGNLWISTADNSASVSFPLNVSYRPWYGWVTGTIAIALGALVSFWSVYAYTRMRRKAENEVLVIRLAETLDSLKAMLNDNTKSGAPPCPKTLQHIQLLRDKGLSRLLDDAELSALAGITVPPTGGVTVVDEIESVRRVVQTGFSQLVQLWTNAAPPPPDPLVDAFAAMDLLGSTPQLVTQIDAQILTIVSAATPPPPTLTASFRGSGAAPDSPQPLPTERVVVHRVQAATHALDILSGLTVVALGVYILIWKNLGFGTPGDILVAFLWGLGLKFGGDMTKLTPNDVRTSFGVNIPKT